MKMTTGNNKVIVTWNSFQQFFYKRINEEGNISYKRNLKRRLKILTHKHMTNLQIGLIVSI